MLKVESRVEARLEGWVCVVEFPWVMLSIFGIFDGSFASVAFQVLGVSDVEISMSLRLDNGPRNQSPVPKILDQADVGQDNLSAMGRMQLSVTGLKLT